MLNQGTPGGKNGVAKNKKKSTCIFCLRIFNAIRHCPSAIGSVDFKQALQSSRSFEFMSQGVGGNEPSSHPPISARKYAGFTSAWQTALCKAPYIITRCLLCKSTGVAYNASMSPAFLPEPLL